MTIFSFEEKNFAFVNIFKHTIDNSCYGQAALHLCCMHNLLLQEHSFMSTMKQKKHLMSCP